MKSLKKLLIIVSLPILLTGCFKRDTMDDITIYTTSYPIEYLVEYLYGYNSTVDSIYPNGVDIHEYTLTDKQIKEYAKTDMFVYNGLTKEKSIAASFLNNNQDIKLIDVSKGLSITHDEEELWLSPSNYLMLAQNIKNSIEEYTSSTIVKQEVEDNYEKLKLIISKYDAELKLIADSSSDKTIIVGNDVFKFLEKYGFTVLSIEDNDTFNTTEFNQAKDNITNKINSYVFTLNTDEDTDNVTSLEDLGATIVSVDSLINLTDEQESEGYDYQEMMVSFIESIKTEVYN